MSISVQLDRFEGPLGLLLYLIKQEEMDIFDIQIHQITKQYLAYIKAMRKLDLEVAGEFVAMAATLLHIKSRMLLPNYGGEELDEQAEDPRKELVQKLVEYQKIQELSQELYGRKLLGRDVFPRGQVEDFEALEEGELIVEDNPLFSLISAYRKALKNMKKTVHRVLGELQSIAARILEIKDRLIVGQRVGFMTLLTEGGPAHPNQVLVTFLSLLELAKMNFVSLFQSDTFAEIHVEAKRTIDRDVVSQVENYESVDTEKTSAAIIQQAQIAFTEAELDDEIDSPAQLELKPTDLPIADPVELATWSEDAATDEEILQEEQRLLMQEDHHE